MLVQEFPWVITTTPFTDEKLGAQMLNNLPKVTPRINGDASVGESQSLGLYPRLRGLPVDQSTLKCVILSEHSLLPRELKN